MEFCCCLFAFICGSEDGTKHARQTLFSGLHGRMGNPPPNLHLRFWLCQGPFTLCLQTQSTDQIISPTDHFLPGETLLTGDIQESPFSTSRHSGVIANLERYNFTDGGPKAQKCHQHCISIRLAQSLSFSSTPCPLSDTEEPTKAGPEECLLPGSCCLPPLPHCNGRNPLITEEMMSIPDFFLWQRRTPLLNTELVLRRTPYASQLFSLLYL